MNATPETDDIARGNHVVPTEWAEQLERERDNAWYKLKRYENAMEQYSKWRGLAVNLYTACVQHYTKDCDQQTAESFMRIMRAAQAINTEFNTESPE